MSACLQTATTASISGPIYETFFTSRIYDFHRYLQSKSLYPGHDLTYIWPKSNVKWILNVVLFCFQVRICQRRSPGPGLQVFPQGPQDGVGAAELCGWLRDWPHQAAQLPAQRDQSPQGLILKVNHLDKKRHNTSTTTTTTARDVIQGWLSKSDPPKQKRRKAGHQTCKHFQVYRNFYAMFRNNQKCII